MNRPFEKVFISWIPPERGGRKVAHPGPQYVTIAHFEEDEAWPDESWSFVVRLLKTVGNGRFWYAEGSFLVDEAPHHLLQPGSRFTLLEGPRIVAKGVVLPPALNVPDHVSEFESALIG